MASPRTGWLALSFVFTGIYGFIGVRETLVSQYFIHDDVRSHVFWMRRFLDPELFPGDIIADYLQSVAPYGYSALYRGIAGLGVDPVGFNKILPIFLAFITTWFCFRLCLRLFPVPAAAFVATVFLNQTLWVIHDLSSGTPRAFIYPLFLGFLDFLLARSLVPCLVAIVLQGLFYPQCLFLSAGILSLRLWRCKEGRFHLTRDPQDYWFWGAGLGLVALMLLPYALKTSEFGPVATAAIAREMPIFSELGRKEFFYDTFWESWFCGERCGLAPYDWCLHYPPFPAFFVLSLPWLGRWPHRFPLVRKVSRDSLILLNILLVSLGMFSLAHIFLFKLHLPSRYTKHSIRILVAIGGAIAGVILFQALWRACRRRQNRALTVLTVGFGVFLLFGYPLTINSYPNPDYVHAASPALYQFFAEQPKDIVIGSLSEEANNIPTLSRRSVLVNSETALPYHLGFFREIERRTLALMLAQYSQNLAPAKQTLETYKLDYWLVDRSAFTPKYIEKNSWLRTIQPIASEALANIREGRLPAIADLLETCQVFATDAQVVLDPKCVLKAAE